MRRDLDRLVLIWGAAWSVAAGCGRQPNSAAVTALQARAAEVDTLVFASMSAVAANAAPNVNETVADRAKAQDAYNATLALPLMPTGTYNCPADFGVTYQLTFLGDGAQIMIASVDPNGCQQVELTDGGSNAALLWTVQSGGYWVTLAADLGIEVNQIFPYFPPVSAD